MNAISPSKPAREVPTHLSIVFARNMKRLRVKRGYSLKQMAELAQIDPMVLRQIEDGRAEPPLALAWTVASILDVPFAQLIAGAAPRGTVVLRHDKVRLLVSESRGLCSRALFLPEEGQRTEFYSLRLAPHHSESSPPHATGSREILHVAEGRIEVTVGREPPHFAEAGDTIIFPADLPHTYRNLTGLPAALYLVMVYPDRPQRADADIETHAIRH
jgi:quercetin dioxygenase-like cupin family protein/DNA-binding XRE family transcriptional regulator